jgi:hypothetical protein
MWPALTYVNPLLIDEAGTRLEVREAANGHVLFAYRTHGALYGSASVSNGAIYVGSTDGNILAFSTGDPTTALLSAYASTAHPPSSQCRHRSVAFREPSTGSTFRVAGRQHRRTPRTRATEDVS